MVEYADMMLALARERAAAGDLSGADAVLRLVLGTGARDAAVLLQLSRLRQAQGQPVEALALARSAVALAPDDSAARAWFAERLWAQGELDAAAEQFAQVLAAEPEHDAAGRGLALVLKTAGRLDQAVAAFRALLRRDPNQPEMELELAGALHRMRCEDAAQAAQHRALLLRPGWYRAELALGYLLLEQGRFAEGWARHEARLRAPDHPVRSFDGAIRWTGEDPAGRSILLHAEQGIGDTIQFIRYAPLLAARGARVIAAVQRDLVPLVADQPWVSAVVGPGEAVPAFDLHCPILSLPFAFATDAATIPPATPYLTPPADRREAWARRLGGPEKPRIGLAFAGNPAHSDDRNRSIPPPLWGGMLACSGVEFHLVQPSRASDPPVAPALHRHNGALRDFADTAALLSLMDLVISVDTAVAHLAGALDRPTWLLLPYAADWRWLAPDRSDSPWYPTMRLFRQPSPGDWPTVLHGVGEALTHWLGTPSQ